MPDDIYSDKNLKIFKNILTYNLNIRGEQLLIVADSGVPGHQICPALAELYGMAARELGIQSKTMYQSVRTRGQDADSAIVKAITGLPKQSTIMVIASDRLGGFTTSAGKTFRGYAKFKEHKFTSTSSLGDLPTSELAYIIDLLDIDYIDTQKKADKLKKAMDHAKELHVTTKAGTDVRYGVQGMRAISATGVYREFGTGGNLPGAETYIAPNKKNVNGTIVIDGSSRTRKGTNLVKIPIRMEVKDGSIIKMNRSSEAVELQETLDWATKQSKYPWGVRRIGELGIALNKKAKLCGSIAIDEKVYGTGHFAIGSNSWFGGSIYSIIHLDQVFWKPEIRADGKRLKW
ncbi:MAG: aminopeptidase [Candidatus Woesearchaeota archaeon]